MPTPRNSQRSSTPSAFVDTIRGGRPAFPAGHDARAVLAIALACISAVQQQRPVRLAEMAPAEMTVA